MANGIDCNAFLFKTTVNPQFPATLTPHPPIRWPKIMVELLFTNSYRGVCQFVAESAGYCLQAPGDVAPDREPVKPRAVQAGGACSRLDLEWE